MKKIVTFFIFSIFAEVSSSQSYMADGRGHLVPLPSPTPGNLLPVTSLNGIWEININAGQTFEFDTKQGEVWKSIEVPGEAMMQGFRIKNDVPFVYRRKMRFASNVMGRKHLIRFNGVYSYAKVYFNGKFVRQHFGGFTAWDCDITSLIKPNQDNWLHIVVVDRADDISYASGYAHHPIGGILRNLQHILLPVEHIKRLYVEATLENNYQTGRLGIDLCLNQAGRNCKVEWSLIDPSGKRTAGRKVQIDENGNAKDEITIAGIKRWTAETPQLYKLNVNLLENGKLKQSTEQLLGFRKVEIGPKNNLLVNGNVVKLRGACRHDMHPLLGRSTNRQQDSLDVMLAKEANINFIRTSHYPPSKDFLEFCDRYGIYVQEETAICFVNDWREGVYKQFGETQNDSAFTGRYLGQLSEMIDRDRNHASVVMWSIGNESNYGINFQKEYEFVKSVDMSRPVSWSWPSTALKEGKRCFDIAVSHYPAYNGKGSDMGGIEKNMEHPDFPVIGDEWAHVACYNTEMLAYDPNVKDYWGRSLDTMWSVRFDVEGNIGGAIWGMIDETFHLPDTVTGYGPWGFIDVWRRKKTEFWNTKKAYSPIRVIRSNLIDRKNGWLEVPVHNRFDHLYLDQVKAYIITNGKSLPLTLPRVAPHAKGIVKIPFQGKDVLLRFFDARGMLIDEELLGQSQKTVTPIIYKGEWKIAETGNKTVLKNEDLLIEIDHKAALISTAVYKGKILLDNGPVFTVNQPQKPNDLKRTGEVYSGAYHADTFYISKSDRSGFVFHTKGRVDRYPVEIVTAIYPNGIIETSYEADSIPSQTWEIGVKFSVARELNTIEWARNGYWSTYPDSHLSATKGIALRNPVVKEAYRVKPGYTVDKTIHDYYLAKTINTEKATFSASEAYRAKKENITHFSLYGKYGVKGKISIIPQGLQAAKMSVQKDGSQYLLITDKWDYWGLSWGNYQGTRNTTKQKRGKIIIKIGG